MILVSQSFGRVSEYRRVALAILSYYAYSSEKNTKAVLFTDNPDWFTPYFEEIPVHFVLLTAEKMSTMRGEIDFLHRMKIALIEEAFQLYNTDILYFDSDTFFIADPTILMAQLSPKKSFMHLWEYQFETIRNMPLPAGETFQAFVRLIERKSFVTTNGALKIDAQMSSWNAGVMMLHQSHAAFIPDIYSLTEQFYPETQNHASEQYAFSILLQTKTELAACDHVIYHYWYGIKKNIIDGLLEEELSKMLVLTTMPERNEFIKELTKRLPPIFDNHLLSLKDNAIQSLNAKNFGIGYKWALKAIFAGAIADKTFIKDLLYHLKRQLTRKR